MSPGYKKRGKGWVSIYASEPENGRNARTRISSLLLADMVLKSGKIRCGEEGGEREVRVEAQRNEGDEER